MQTLPEPQLSTGVERTAYKYVASWGLITPPTHTHLVAAVSGLGDDSCLPMLSLPSQGWRDLAIQFESFLLSLLAAPTLTDVLRCEREVVHG